MKYLAFISLLLFTESVAKTQVVDEVGIIDITTNTIPGELLFSNINLRDFTSGIEPMEEISQFGSVQESRVHETIAETDYYYFFNEFSIIFAQLFQTPELVELRSANPNLALKFKNLLIRPGQKLDDLAIPLQDFARTHNVLPEFRIVSSKQITDHPSGDSSIRIAYDIEMEGVVEVLYLGSAL